MDTRAIGVFDSGLGGLSVVREIIKLLPKEDIVYLGDTARVPYGTRSAEVVRKFSREDANFLLSKNVKCIVIACNTSSAFAGNFLKRKIKTPVFEVIMASSKKAVEVSKKGRIGVIGTTGTIRSEAYEKEVIKNSPKAKVTSVPCPLLVHFIEEGEFGPALNVMVNKYLSLLKKKKVDTLILGCTHYPIIKGKIGKYLGKGVQLVNPGEEVAKELKEFLQNSEMLSKRKKAKRQYFVTDVTKSFIKVAEMFLGERLDGKIKKVTLVE